MSRSALETMLAGDWYSCIDDELEAMRRRARLAVHEHNSQSPDQRGRVGWRLANLFDQIHSSAVLEAPFHCSYGCHISLGADVYLNAGCVILDSAPVSVGAGTMLGPMVQIYCADHHRDAGKRSEGLERALPVTIGQHVWIGGGAILLPGVRVGDNAIVGAGSVVARDVPENARVAGNPARRIG